MTSFRATPEGIEQMRKYIADYFDVDVASGVVRWARQPRRGRRSPDGLPGSLKSDGYRMLHVAGRLMTRARVIFFCAEGWMPETVDHIDGNPSNDALKNLRAATERQNNANRHFQSNNTSGFLGVRWNPGRKKWVAEVYGERRQSKRFDRREDAIAWRSRMAKAAYGEFAPDDSVCSERPA